MQTILNFGHYVQHSSLISRFGFKVGEPFLKMTFLALIFDLGYFLSERLLQSYTLSYTDVLVFNRTFTSNLFFFSKMVHFTLNLYESFLCKI